MCGGSEPDVERARPILAAMGKTITHMGPVGAGQATKAVNQVILAGTYLGVAEGLVLAIKAGLDPETVVEALSGGAAGSWVLQNRSGRMIADDYPLGFRIALHRKDLGIALELARQVGAALPVAGLAEQIENGLIAQGHGDDDNSALARAIREWSGTVSARRALTLVAIAVTALFARRVRPACGIRAAGTRASAARSRSARPARWSRSTSRRA